MGNSQRHVGAAAMTYPDFPWSSIGGGSGARRPALTSDDAVAWLRGLVPCPTCQTVEEYLLVLSRASIPNLLKIIADYEVTGRTDSPTCTCRPAKSAPSPADTPPALPQATCHLRDQEGWDYDLNNPSPAALGWIKSRWSEKDAEDKMRTAWARYVTNPESKSRFYIGTDFVPWAIFPRLWGGTNEELFGPGPGLNGYDGALLMLKNRPRASTNLAAGCHGQWMAFLNRPPPCSDDRRGPPLTPAVGTMVRQPNFGDMDVRTLFACYSTCDVEIRASQGWAGVGFALPPGVKDHAFPLKGLQGETVLFLACCIVADDAACFKLLQMRETGATVLKDLVESGFTGVLEGRARECLGALMAAAMDVSTAWNLPALCERLALWFRVWIHRPAAEHLHRVQPLDLVGFVQSLFELWLGPAHSGTRLFAPDTFQGWEDTAEVTAMGAYYGAAVGAVTLASLAAIKARVARMAKHERRADVTEEWVHNGVAILTAAFGVSAALGTNATKKSLLRRLNRSIVEANDDEIDRLFSLLHDTQANLRSVAESYAEHIDGHRLHGAFQQAFGCVVAQHFPLPLEAVQTFFNAPGPAVAPAGTLPALVAPGTVGVAGPPTAAVPASTGGPQHYTSLRHGAVTHFNALFGPFIFADLASLKVHNYPPGYLNTNPRFKRCWDASAAQGSPLTEQLAQQSVQLAHLASTPIQPGSPSTTLKSAAVEVVQQVRRQRSPAPASSAVGWRAVASLRAKILTAFVFLAVACLLPLQPSAWIQTAQSQPDTLFSTGTCSAIGARCVVQQTWEIAERLHVGAGDTVEVLASPASGWLKVRAGDGDAVGVSSLRAAETDSRSFPRVFSPYPDSGFAKTLCSFP